MEPGLNHVDIAAAKLSVPAARASTALCVSIDQFEFASEFKESLGEGFTPFAIIPPGVKSARGKKALSDEIHRGAQYDLMAADS